MTSVLKSLAVLVLLISAAFAQTQTQFAGSGGIATAKSKGSITLPMETLMTYIVDGTQTVGNVGTISFITPSLASGTLADGGVYAAGGVVSISIPALGITYLGEFVEGATLQKTTNNVYYLLTAHLIDANGNTAVIVVTTSVFRSGHFVSPTTIAAIDGVIN